MGVCGVIILGASQGQMSVILASAAGGEEVTIHTFGAMDVGMLTLLAFLTCREHFFGYYCHPWHRDDKHVGGLASGESGVFSIQIVCWLFHMFGSGPPKSQLHCFHQVLCPNTCFLCCNVISNFHEVYPS